jgi:hypothetical protein
MDHEQVRRRYARSPLLERYANGFLLSPFPAVALAAVIVSVVKGARFLFHFLGP